MGIDVAPLQRARLAEAEQVLAESCAFDRAAVVADEKLFGPGPTSAAQAFGAWDGTRRVGVASVAARWLRLIAVVPDARRQGVGAALLAACETAARANAQAKLSVLAQPGNYLAPGIDERNTEVLAWLDKRGFERGAELHSNVLIAVRDNPRVTPTRLAEAISNARDRGYEVRRANAAERAALTAAIADEFGGAWPFEVDRAFGPQGAVREEDNRASGAVGAVVGAMLTAEHLGAMATAHVGAIPAVPFAMPGVHIAMKDGAFCAFAAHDGNNRGLGWFGPTGTWPAHRGQGLGEALLLACLLDVAALHAHCEVAWIGPRPFYDKVAGIASERRFVTFTKQL